MPTDLLRQVWGFDGFRPGQQEIVEAVAEGRDVLAIMPTGGGKSLCYQLPALMREGVTVVISPLIALMRDQVEALLPLQASSGMWHTLLAEPGSYAETSATAGFAYGLLKGARLGLGCDRWRGAGLRALDAVQATDGVPIATPADWQPGQDVIAALSLTDEQAEAKFGRVDKKLPYLRFVAQPARG